LTRTRSLCTSLATALLSRSWMLATAESCTGGMIAARCTDLAGSSAWFERGFVTYSNAAKTELLGVSPSMIEAHGAVSEAVACAMASGAMACSHAQVSLAVTGIAGPSGGSIEKPVGTVWCAWHVDGHLSTERWVFEGDRALVREATVVHALEGLITRLGRNPDG
jgi:nicotinamide-nucleotide amidase